MTEHRVLSHPGLQAQEYDAAIRTYIPAYETMLATVVAIVRDHVGTGDGLVIDLVAIADATVHADGPEHAHIYARWAAEMATHGIEDAEALRLFAAWAQEDRYQPLSTELGLLADAGFARPGCF
jgi:hypothetical protein